MLFFDIGANRGDATEVALAQGYEVIALEPAPIYSALIRRYIYDRRVLCLRNAVSDTSGDYVDFYVADEDGLSTLNEEWLTADNMPYAGKSYHRIQVHTVTIDALAHTYGEPDLIKIDVEGAEWNVLRGMSRKYGVVALEWTLATLDQHEAQMGYMYSLGYRQCAAQYIVGHLEQPKIWGDLQPSNRRQLLAWHQTTSDEWIDGGWREAGLRPTADVGMLWFR